MNEKNIELPDLLWSCFINWINTLEKSLNLNSEQKDDQKTI